MYESLGLDKMDPKMLGMIVVGLVLLGTVLAVYFMSPKSGVVAAPSTGTGTGGAVTVTPGGVVVPPPQTVSAPAPAQAPAPAAGAPFATPSTAGTGVSTGLPIGGEEQQGLSTGAIVGIVLGIVALIVLVMGGVKTRKAYKAYKGEDDNKTFKGFAGERYEAARVSAGASLKRAKASLGRAGRSFKRTITSPFAYRRAKITQKLFRQGGNEDEALLTALLYFNTHTLVNFFEMAYAVISSNKGADNEDAKGVAGEIEKARKTEIQLAREKDAFRKTSGIAKMRLLYVGSDGLTIIPKVQEPETLINGAIIFNTILLDYQKTHPGMLTRLFQKFQKLSLKQKNEVVGEVVVALPGSENSLVIQDLKKGNLARLSEWWGGVTNWFRSLFNKQKGAPSENAQSELA